MASHGNSRTNVFLELAGKLDLLCIKPDCWDSAKEAFISGDGVRFVSSGYSSGATLDVVVHNLDLLKERGIFEAALVEGYIGSKTNNRTWPVRILERLFQEADRAKLRAAGETLPSEGPHIVYRGVTGEGQKRLVRGLSWTSSFDLACHFAMLSDFDPAVYKAKLKEAEVFCYTNQRFEEEFIARPKRIRRMPLSLEVIQEGAKRHFEGEKKRRRARFAKRFGRT